jgi:hypothetical protein
LTDAATFDRAVAQGHDLPAVEMRPGRHISGLAKPVDLVVLA